MKFYSALILFLSIGFLNFTSAYFAPFGPYYGPYYGYSPYYPYPYAPYPYYGDEGTFIAANVLGTAGLIGAAIAAKHAQR